MLTERTSQLLSAYVDGELTARQRKGVEKLLRRSLEARDRLRRLQADAVCLRELPRRSPGNEFAAEVLGLIDQGQVIRLPDRASRRADVPAWVGLATAAAVVAAISLGSYHYFTRVPDREAHGALIAQGKNKEAPRNVRGDDPERGPVEAARQPQNKDGPTPATPDRQEEPRAADVAVKPNAPEPARPVAEESALTSPVPNMEMFQPKKPDVHLGLIVPARNLDANKVRGELKKSQAVHLELPCRETARAFARVEAALKANGAGLLVDQIAQARLKLPCMKTNYVFYLEDMTADELTALLQHLGDDDQKAEAKHKGDGLFENLIVDRMTDVDHKELTQLLGVDPRTPPARPAAPLGVDPRKPLSETTGTQVAQALAGQGGTPRPDGAKPSVKPPERQALAMAYNPVRPPAGSADVKRFLEARKASRPGTVQVLLVLRGI